jgi:TPR repeat protein
MPAMSRPPGMWAGLPSDRVMAVVASLDTGQVQVGSGYLVTERLVLTAWHCAIDRKTGRPATKLQVVCRSGGPEASATLLAAQSELDVAVLAVEDPPWVVPVVSEPPRFGRLDRSGSGEVHYCQAIGFPLWQVSPEDQERNAAELHGTIRAAADPGSGSLVMRDPLLHYVTIPVSANAEDRAGKSPWGGLSGALMFGQGIALGVVIEHHPRQDGSAMRILPVERFASPPAGGDADTAAVAAALGLPPVDGLPLAGERPVVTLVEEPAQGRLPRVSELNPYTLGATPSEFGNSDTYGQRDEYVPRVKDEPLTAALSDRAQVVLVGPSKAGKTRTAFEVIRQHSIWGSALLASPGPKALEQLSSHPGLSSADPLVIWLDELDRFLPGGELSPAMIARLLDRPGPTLLLASLRSGQRQRLQRDGKLTRDVRSVLDNFTSLELASTCEDPGEQARAAAIYPQLGSKPGGLAEMLAGAPELLRLYQDAAGDDPPLHVLVRLCVDWARCGLARPMPEPDLLALARDALQEHRPDLDPADGDFRAALGQARTPRAGGGQVGLLGTVRLADGSCGYWPFDYLVAADEGQQGSIRPIAENTWLSWLEHATDEDAFAISFAAFAHENVPVAIVASHRAAEAGNVRAQYNLGVLLADQLEPPEMAAAVGWYTRAAEAGHTGAQYELGMLLADRLEPPDLAKARTWYTQAAEAGHTIAQYNLGVLLAERLDPPDLAGARAWYTTAAEAGHVSAQYNLGVLLAERLDPPDLAGARAWYTTAAEAGHVSAQYNLGLLAMLLDPPDLDEARTWYTKAAEAGHVSAQNNLGVLLGTLLEPPDLAGARTWWTRAAEAGHAGAQNNLGVLLATLLEPPDLAGARTWYAKAAQAGLAEARDALEELGDG